MTTDFAAPASFANTAAALSVMVSKSTPRSSRTGALERSSMLVNGVISAGRRDSSPAAGFQTGLLVPRSTGSQDWSPGAGLETRRPVPPRVFRAQTAREKTDSRAPGDQTREIREDRSP